MKKIFALALVIVMMAAISIPVFADADPNATDYEATLDETVLSNGTTVRYGVEQTYTVTIPVTISVGTNLAGSGDVTVSNVYIPAGKNIKVSVTSANNPASNNNAWELVDIATTGSKADNVGYKVIVDGDELARGDQFLSAASAATFTAVTKTINIQVNKTMQVATYEDKLTFSVSIAA